MDWQNKLIPSLIECGGLAVSALSREDHALIVKMHLNSLLKQEWIDEAFSLGEGISLEGKELDEF